MRLGNVQEEKKVVMRKKNNFLFNVMELVDPTTIQSLAQDLCL